MKIVIAGAGEVGTHLAKMLSNEEQDIILIDSNQQALDNIDSNYNLMTCFGSTSSMETMREIGVSSCDLFIAVTPYETKNITSCTIAKALGAKKTVGRIDNFEFILPHNKRILSQIGVDDLIYPEHLAANEIATSLDHTWARYWGDLHDGKLMIIGVKVRDNSQLVNCELRNLPVSGHNFHIVAIKHGLTTIIPSGSDMISADDIVYFITTNEHMDEIREMCGKVKRNIKSIIIVGASRICIRFALQFQERYDIKIIEADRDKCEEVAALLPDCEVVCGDARNVEVLRENNIFRYDAFMALTDSSETNILACLTAKEFNVPKTIAEVENIQFISQAEKLNIGNIINKKLLASSRIFQLLLDADADNSKCLALADAEVAEIQVKKGANITKKLVRDLHLPYGMTLGAYTRDGRCYLIDGNTKIEAGDYVVVFCLSGFIHKIEKWFN
jgi:trk system potassium uptake protein TrkA